MSRWKKLLEEVKKIEEKYGDSLRRQSSQSEITKLQDKIKEKYGNILLPETYVEFLKMANGIDFNGLVVYGIDEHLQDKDKVENVQGFMETNEIWHENDWHRQFIFFGDSDTAWYCYNLNENVYMELDKPSGTLINTYDSFDNMLTDALETSLM